jgi:hypothetical protein
MLDGIAGLNLPDFYMDGRDHGKEGTVINDLNLHIESAPKKDYKFMDNGGMSELIRRNEDLDKKNLLKKNKRTKKMINPKFYGHWHC